MKQFGIFFSLVLCVLICSCEGDVTNKAVGGELTVHYIDKSDQKLAEEIVLFWKENDLISGEEQDLQLEKIKKTYSLSIIAKDTSKIDDMPFQEKRLLNELKMKLWEEVFDRSNFNLVISDDKFKPLYTVGK